MNRLSVSASIEQKLLQTIRTLVPAVPCVGLLEVAAAGSEKDENLTSFQVRVYNFQQPHEATGAFTVSAEVRLNVEQAESANGALFAGAHEAFALWLERVMLGDECVALSTDEAFVDGFQRGGDDKDFDSATGTWFAVWNITLSGRIRPDEPAETTEPTEQEADNG